MGVIKRTLRFTLGLILGVGIGSVAGMLLAPQSGEQTQAKLQERIDQIINAGKSAQHDREKELQEYWAQQVEAKK